MNRRTLMVIVAAIAIGLLWGVRTLTSGKSHIAAHHSSAIRSSPFEVASEPSAITAGARLPPEFSILETHSVFGPSRKAVSVAGGPDAGFVVKGVIQVGQVFTAFVEDVLRKRVMQVTAGDLVARGRIKSIDIDAVEYIVASNTRRIAVGQNLEGVDVPAMPTSRPAGKGESPGSDGPSPAPLRTVPRMTPPAEAPSAPALVGPGAGNAS